MSSPVIQTLSARPVLGVRASVRQAEIGDVIGRLLPALLAVAGPHVAGPPLARWHAWEGDRGDMELAVPVSTPQAPSGTAAPGELPGGRAAVLEHVGSYDGLAAAWERMRVWLEAEGHQGAGAPWEEYVSDCGVTPAEQLVTRIVWPLV